MASEIVIECDGQERRATIDDERMPLLYVLTDVMGLDNPRYGCGVGQCGACMVHLDGTPVRSCVTPARAASGRKVTTIAGLGTPENPHPLQEAFVKHQATQCGYCINGWIMAAAALVRDKPGATGQEVREGLRGLVCRCGSHMSILRAVEDAAKAGT